MKTCGRHSVDRGLLLFEFSFDTNVVFHMPILLKNTISTTPDSIFEWSTKKDRQINTKFYKIYPFFGWSQKKKNKVAMYPTVYIMYRFLKIYQSKLPSLTHGLPSFLVTETALSTKFKSSAAMVKTLYNVHKYN